jgi:hypothetical protein
MDKGTFTPAQSGYATTEKNRAITLSDPSSALAQFKVAAQAIESKYPGALTAYNKYVNQGTKGQLDLQTQALISSLPVSNTATDTMNELRGYLGLKPVSPTAGLSLSLDNTINKLQATGGDQSQVGRLMAVRDQLAQAENVEDPAKRQALKAQISSTMNNYVKQLGSLGPQYSDLVADLQDVQGKFDIGYGRDPMRAMSASDIQAKLEASPAYQFRLNQGIKAMDRSAAAKGELLSGKTLLGAQQFGQDMASQEYDNEVRRLQSLANSALPALYQNNALLANMGQSVGQVGQQQGAVAGDIAQKMAQAQQQAGNLSGQALLSTGAMQGQMANQQSLTDAQQQQQALLANAQFQQQAAAMNAKANYDPNKVMQGAQLLGRVQETLNPSTNTSSLPYNGGVYTSGATYR